MSFRQWTEQLRNIKGNQPLWPWLLGSMLSEEFERQVCIDDSYAGDIFIDRDQKDHQEGLTERRMVATLYHHCLSNTEGCIEIDDERIWLLGYEWPTQGGDREKGRRADLVGLRKDGSLVVFECKRADNSDPPLTAVIEGLDYLACLLRPKNFLKITTGFCSWNEPEDKAIPNGFLGVNPRKECRPMLVVLAPAIYYHGRYTRSQRGAGWADMSTIGEEMADAFSIRFASSEFDSGEAHWV